MVLGDKTVNQMFHAEAQGTRRRKTQNAKCAMNNAK
jgi:hypothetical protein